MALSEPQVTTPTKAVGDLVVGDVILYRPRRAGGWLKGRVMRDPEPGRTLAQAVVWVDSEPHGYLAVSRNRRFFVEPYPQTEDEARECPHGNRVWFGHECGLCDGGEPLERDVYGRWS